MAKKTICDECGQDLAGKIQVYARDHRETRVLCENCNWMLGNDDVDEFNNEDE